MVTPKILYRQDSHTQYLVCPRVSGPDTVLYHIRVQLVKLSIAQFAESFPQEDSKILLDKESKTSDTNDWEG